MPRTIESGTDTCSGHSALGECAASVRYVVAATGPDRRYPTCGRHVSWLLSAVLSEGEQGTVTRVAGSSDGPDPRHDGRTPKDWLLDE